MYNVCVYIYIYTYIYTYIYMYIYRSRAQQAISEIEKPLPSPPRLCRNPGTYFYTIF